MTDAQNELTFRRLRQTRTAFFLAIASIPLMMTGYLSLFTAGVAIMLVVLSRDEAGRIPGQGIVALIISGCAIAVSLFILYQAIFQVLLPALNDPAALAEMDAYYMETFGFSLSELMEQLNGTR